MASPTPTLTFVVTGSMHDRRMNATATLLADGRVLIAGGHSDRYVMSMAVLASAELYDPATGRFTPTGSMITARTGHTATLLPDGRVLIAGGYGCLSTKTCTPDDAIFRNGGGSLASAELYDPATGEFTRTGSMTTPREDATATLLRDGRVLVASGSVENAQEAVDLYDPATGEFMRAGSLLFFYTVASAVLLRDGKVLLVGPVYGGTVAEEYDPASDKSTGVSLSVPLMAARPTSHLESPATATLLEDGRILLCLYAGNLWTYDSAIDSFTPSGSIVERPARWTLPTATLLADSRVLFAGGAVYDADDSYDGVAAAAAGLFDPADGFHLISPMNTARFDHTATLLPDGSVLIAGGTADALTALSSAELLRP